MALIETAAVAQVKKETLETQSEWGCRAAHSFLWEEVSLVRNLSQPTAGGLSCSSAQTETSVTFAVRVNRDIYLYTHMHTHNMQIQLLWENHLWETAYSSKKSYWYCLKWFPKWSNLLGQKGIFFANTITATFFCCFWQQGYICCCARAIKSWTHRTLTMKCFGAGQTEHEPRHQPTSMSPRTAPPVWVPHTFISVPPGSSQYNLLLHAHMCTNITWVLPSVLHQRASALRTHPRKISLCDAVRWHLHLFCTFYFHAKKPENPFIHCRVLRLILDNTTQKQYFPINKTSNWQWSSDSRIKHTEGYGLRKTALSAYIQYIKDVIHLATCPGIFDVTVKTYSHCRSNEISFPSQSLTHSSTLQNWASGRRSSFYLNLSISTHKESAWNYT